MNVSTAAEVGSTQTNTANTTKTSKSSGKSFDEELKTTSQETKDTETSKEVNEKSDNNSEKVSGEKSSEKSQTDLKNDLTKDNNDNLQQNELLTNDFINGAVNFTDFKYGNNSQNILSQNIQNLLDTRNLISSVQNAAVFDYDSVNMSDSDANFFVNLVQNTDMSMKDISSYVENEILNISKDVQSNVQVSSVLMNKLADSMKTGQSFRIDFDKDISVIIKVNKDGSLMANFIPGDKAVEQYLKNNIASLRQRFDDENLSYSELSYSNSRGQQQKKQKKENENE